MNTTDTPKNIHQGRNVKRFREMLGLKQEALAIALGEEWSQKRVSLLEAKEVIEPELLTKVANALKVPEEAIKNFDEEKAINNIQNNYDNAVIHAGPAINFQCTFNPIDKWLEVIEENKKLYERLLQSEREKVEILKNKG
ncbi:helix-turn-helix transcriptional regulator [Mucilaginibacter rubeus]|uniref:Helix-turn-helix transcriptional regulator n=1 Tax=Mucilaginibacter rubeus TaxID=2027860 RepID=A0AAE6JIM7_9SPHI|nr:MULTISPECIES: helix-turn-helix transcriptional regulator [Mucilaginibacter]QEM06325.1 helix-turn-helix transcriptional regulator [Mucilaginibacter rubeus]QEM18906.1 helix-turn-helix transcriptional regulator [Mucilaginibacter gossypii]QTE44551.1 helix-turn-helix transcriptional regulator [Mucilaginibacter rubeus]QTE51149.1 helix-turn-helix transcriptional regulator [Mucilaginibacter rubeus]QTE56235.1 helix-turn-helix transcriptional regulator [Mucilaginibacter rubeus]